MSAETPQLILEATEALLLEAGADGLSIRKVSERCGFSAPTIYHHFGDKNGLVDALLEARFQPLLAAMRAIPPTGDPAADLREMARTFLAFALANPDHYRLLSAPLGRQQPVPSAEAAREIVRGALAELARDGTLATPDLDAAFQVLWSVVHGLISLQLQGRGDLAKDTTDLALDVVERGLLRRAPNGDPS